MAAERFARWKPLLTILAVLAMVAAASVVLIFLVEAGRDAAPAPLTAARGCIGRSRPLLGIVAVVSIGTEMADAKPSIPLPLVVAIGLAVALAAGVASRAVVRRVLAPAVPGAAAADIGNPREFLRAGSRDGGQAFRRRLARAAERSVKRAAPRSRVVFDEETALEDLGTAMRGQVAYRGQVYEDGDDFDGVRVEGEQRQYFHATGAIVVDAVCAPAAMDCGGRDRVLEAAETAVLAHLDQPGLDGLLPEQGRCEVPEGSTAAAIASCEVDGGVVLTVQRLTLAETILALQPVARPSR